MPGANRGRAAARRVERGATAPTASVPRWAAARTWRLALWALATALVLGLAFAAIERKVTWYLAVDQLGNLLFAQDLLQGKLFHDWQPARVLASLLPEHTDVLAQTYVWDHGRLYSRYAPGYPIMVAAWVGLFGQAAVHHLNPIIFLAVLAVLIAFEWRVHRSLWRGTALAVLVMTCPTGVSLWALTPTRDVASHLFALLGLVLLAGHGRLGRRSALASGLALGWAGCIRPDALLYLLPAAVFLVGRWWARRERGALPRLAATAALGVVIGLTPSFAYYWAATGNPLVPTQSMEVSDFLGTRETPTQVEPESGQIGYPPAAWRGTTATPVSGGGLRLEYLPTTLPGNWEKIRTAYGGALLTLAACGIVVAAVLRPTFALALGSYLLVAILFYSCWGRPYGRYLISTWLLVPILIMEGAVGSFDLVRYAERRGGAERARWVAGAGAGLLVLVYLVAAPEPDATARLALTRVLALGSAAGLAGAAVWPQRRIATIAVPALVLVLVCLGSVRLWQTLAFRAPFQRAEATRAAAVIRRTLESPAVVITSEQAGRPMENLEYYADVRSLYLTDLERWHIPLERAVFELMIAEMDPYLLLPRSVPETVAALMALKPHFLVELVQEVPPERAYDFFVASPYHTGVPLQLWHVR